MGNEREKFERFAELMDLPPARKGDSYTDPRTRVAWTAWQARAFLEISK